VFVTEPRDNPWLSASDFDELASERREPMMRVPAQCPECRQGPDAGYLKEMDAADLHSGKLTLRCKQGHETVVTLPIPAFELLFDFGCAALLDGYPREAITDFASSFERFEEFTCRFLLARRNVSFEGVDAWWKEVATSSERQIGSFVALWISEFFRPPPLLSQKLVKLRNDCVHKGLIPPESEAKAYGEAVLRAEVRGIVTLRNCFDSDLEYDDFIDDHIIRPDVSEPYLPSFVGNTVLSGMWRPNEPPDEDDPDEDEAWGFQMDRTQKNTTDPTTLTIDRALQIFDGLRGFGLRR
jgi:hypothetical protein